MDRRIGKAVGVRVSASPKDPGKVKYASAHDLRRSFGERWAAKLMPVQLKELMRHESIETTLRFYVGRNAEAAAKVMWEAYQREADNKSGNAAPTRPARAHAEDQT